MREIKRQLRLILIDDSTVYNLVTARVYPNPLAGIGTPVYPLLCFSLSPGSVPVSTLNDLKEASIRMWYYSSTNHDQAMQIYEAARSVLFNKIVRGTGFQFRVREEITAYEGVDESEGQSKVLFFVTNQWRVTKIG